MCEYNRNALKDVDTACHVLHCLLQCYSFCSTRKPGDPRATSTGTASIFFCDDIGTHNADNLLLIVLFSSPSWCIISAVIIFSVNRH
jgi:hypothetical protein